MFDFISASELSALWQVLIIDLVLAGDNAIVVGLAAASVAPELRRKVIVLGIAVAVIMRIGFAVVTVQLLEVPGVKLVGGALLLWVCWRFLDDLLKPPHRIPDLDAPERPGRHGEHRLGRAILQIALADLSMSLDNVLAVASAAGGHEWVLVLGLIVSIVLMAIAATLIAGLLEKHRWIGWIGLAVIVYVAVKMVWEGFADFGWVGHWPI
ncbi:MAG: TerC family protein [Alphaproteobacteria bacterium]|nr:TerC family protein [Alphaproteobacteria bacterium]